MTEQKETMKKILDKIEQYDKIVIARHKRPDGDAIGSTLGLRGILRLTYPKKDVRLINGDMSDYLAFLGGEDEPVEDEWYKDALMIVVDTATLDRISNPNAHLAKEIVKIDHHIDIKPYGDLCWIEDWRSSACEMIAFFYDTFKNKLKMDLQTATYVFCGMVTDSGRFRYETVTGDTLRLAANLLDFGIDTDTMYAHLYLEDFDYLKFQAYVYKKMQISENGVAYLYVDKKMQKKFALTSEQACEAISFLKGIKGCIAWIAFIEMADGTIRVRLRSRFMTINKLAEKYNGGGHEYTCGATLTNKKQAAELIADGDKMVAEYKATHEGWL
ncbi:MAG: bifunctional oligoribonuclease/PAP phosphatase NrnA [Corallococcus sp.]|nr:bifunctional oligoribonuclease/PAP phosphatase NrnA [Corallococcus sp.]MCM1359616.1 bifunctional oligoribonuclease/PAP phosphatase NrnA [Corallococcus sp.]MCM1395208.1 bifunctional oligoribonuclease/PAP phosphatase NrnA [Corallococcus sp.]